MLTNRKTWQIISHFHFLQLFKTTLLKGNVLVFSVSQDNRFLVFNKILIFGNFLKCDHILLKYKLFLSYSLSSVLFVYRLEEN